MLYFLISITEKIIKKLTEKCTNNCACVAIPNDKKLLIKKLKTL